MYQRSTDRHTHYILLLLHISDVLKLNWSELTFHYFKLTPCGISIQKLHTVGVWRANNRTEHLLILWKSIYANSSQRTLNFLTLCNKATQASEAFLSSCYSRTEKLWMSRHINPFLSVALANRFDIFWAFLVKLRHPFL